MEEIKIEKSAPLLPRVFGMGGQQSQFGYNRLYAENTQIPQAPIIMNQPGECIPQPEVAEEPKSYAVLAWFTCLCCCWPIGIYSIFKSQEVNKAIRRGDMAGARDASRKARNSSLVAFIIGSIALILLTTYYIKN